MHCQAHMQQLLSCFCCLAVFHCIFSSCKLELTKDLEISLDVAFAPGVCCCWLSTQVLNKHHNQWSWKNEIWETFASAACYWWLVLHHVADQWHKKDLFQLTERNEFYMLYIYFMYKTTLHSNWNSSFTWKSLFPFKYDLLRYWDKKNLFTSITQPYLPTIMMAHFYL